MGALKYVTVSIDRIAKDSGVNVMSVRKSFANLKRAGLVDFDIVAGNRIRYAVINEIHPTICLYTPDNLS
ncbi:hypothetical protein ACFPYJ_17710 [Paenibacillus solisilvae]|uniref:Uncharacterized protein n=1 Tax=Paenibacillus solisilvae TaxID=2486751 RepID=A0ABW0VYH9_9BACL